SCANACPPSIRARLWSSVRGTAPMGTASAKSRARNPQGINMSGFQFTLRPSKNDEREARFRLIERAWRVAYAHIYTPEEIDGVFDSTISSYGDWVDRRKGHIAHIGADYEGEIIGFISLSLLKNDEGEVAALYILPAFQGRGVGQALWDAGCARLRDLGCPAV